MEIVTVVMNPTAFMLITALYAVIAFNRKETVAVIQIPSKTALKEPSKILRDIVIAVMQVKLILDPPLKLVQFAGINAFIAMVNAVKHAQKAIK